jgi:hypothetical protein
MMNFTPYKQINLIANETSREEARQIIGGKISITNKDIDNAEVDCFNDKDIHIYYRDNLYVKFIEFFQGSNLIIDGIDFFNLPIGKVSKLSPKYWGKLEEIGLSVFGFKDVGIVFYVPTRSRIESVGIILDRDYLFEYGMV